MPRKPRTEAQKEMHKLAERRRRATPEGKAADLAASKKYREKDPAKRRGWYKESPAWMAYASNLSLAPAQMKASDDKRAEKSRAGELCDFHGCEETTGLIKSRTRFTCPKHRLLKRASTLASHRKSLDESRAGRRCRFCNKTVHLDTKGEPSKEGLKLCQGYGACAEHEERAMVPRDSWDRNAVPTWKAPVGMVDFLDDNEGLAWSRVEASQWPALLCPNGKETVVAYDFEFDVAGGLAVCPIRELGWAVEGAETFAMDVGDYGAAAKLVKERFGGGGDILWLSWSRNKCDETLFRRLVPDIPPNWRFVNAHTLAQTLWPARGQMTEAEAAAQTCAAQMVFPSRQLRVVAAELCPTQHYHFHMPDQDATALLVPASVIFSSVSQY
ncbi:hypothetical protein HDU88_000801 [Geranomyces variabilis]|nr:hypothetical protein HDU88_000801 [Geranomyces variabilis]